MSETDDTDELLIIPPDFFLTNPALDCYLDNLGPYYGVVDGLITQVSQLENRINHIESCSEISVSLIGDSPEMNSPHKHSTSTQSTPQKPRTKFTVNSLPNSPDFKKGASPKSKKLGEIDHFLSNVKLLKRLSAVRNLENDFKGAEKTIALNQVEEMLKEVELQEKEKVLWQAGDNVGSVPDYGYGMRREMYPEPKQTFPDTSLDKTESDSSSESTKMTAFDKFKYKPKPNVEDNNFNLGLVSLSKLWNTSELREFPTKFQQKLQEERLRRQHCEQAIQELQNRILELQERVAVAVQVDEAKDKAILRFHDSWEKAGNKLQNIEKEKEGLEAEIDKLRRKLDEESGETVQKIVHYEKEASKALNLAHTSQDKLAALERKYSLLENELKTVETNSEEFQRKYLAEIEKNRQYPDILAQKELELNECRSVLAEATKEVSQSKRTVEMCQAELIAVKNENETLHSKLDSEKENTRKISDQKNKLLEEINAHKSIARGLQDELTKTREQMETNKVELKNFYQGQVEIVVQSKLKDFQKQLDDAERALKDELAKKEMSIAKTAASHIQQISEKHSLEIKLLEEKHQEECRLYQLQISQLRHELDDAGQKIKRQQDKHLHIEKQLHRFMESLRQDHVTTLDEMNTFRSKSFNNLEEILSFSVDDDKDKMVETPLSSRNDRGGRRKESNIQETIQMLLDKRGQGDEREVTREGAHYYKVGKDGKGKPPWK